MSPLDAALSPFERASEIVFGILMAISVTAAFEITAGGDLDVRELMIGALGCNLAWGLIDGVMYLLQQQFERFRNHRRVLELRAIKAPDEFRQRVADALPPFLASSLTADTYARIRQAVDSYSGRRPHFWPRQDFAVAATICFLVFASTFPLVIPFMVMDDPWLAMRTSHAVAVAFLFFLGWRLGQWSGASALGAGVVFAAVGTALAVACVALGG